MKGQDVAVTFAILGENTSGKQGSFADSLTSVTQIGASASHPSSPPATSKADGFLTSITCRMTAQALRHDARGSVLSTLTI